MIKTYLRSLLALLALGLAAPFAQSASDTTITAGGAVSLSVTADGTSPFSYVWTKDGATIPGATGANYSIASFSASNAGTYVATVSNALGSTVSDSAKLILLVIANVAPTITTQPQSQLFKDGGAINLTVVATGTPAPTYQWYRNGVAIPGATSASNSTTTATAAMAGSYYVVVSNAGGSVQSATAILTFGTAPSGAILKVTKTP